MPPCLQLSLQLVRLPPLTRRAVARRGMRTTEHRQRRRCIHLAVVVSHAQAHQLAAIEHLERLHQELLVWRPPPPPPPPPPPKESKWRGPMMDAYGEPIGGGTFYTGAKDGGESNVVTR